MNELEYRLSPAIGGSDASAMCVDYEKWAYLRRLRLDKELPDWLQSKETDAQAFGTATHMALLEPEEYKKNAYILKESVSFATKAGKAIKDAFQDFKERNPRALLIKMEDAWEIEQIRKNFERDIRPKIMTRGQWLVEERFFYTADGWKIKGTIDLRTEYQLIDIKTTRDIFNVEDSISHYCYHVQTAHYNHYAKCDIIAFIFIENEAPYRCRWVELDEEMMKFAKDAWIMALDKAAADGLLIK